MEISIKWNICRICLAEDKPSEKLDMLEIFADRNLAKQIYECSGIEIKQSDNLPEKICKKCITFLQHAIKFRTTCRKSNKYLQTIVQKTKSASTLFKVEKNDTKIDMDIDESDNNVDFFEDEQIEEYVIPQNELTNDNDNVNDDDGHDNDNDGNSTKELLSDLCGSEANSKDDTKDNEICSVSKNENNTKICVKKSPNSEKERKQEGSEIETVIAESDDGNVVFLIGDLIKQENEEECSESYEIEEQSYSNDMTVTRYSYNNEEFISVDANSDNYIGEQFVLRPQTLRKYEKKVIKPIDKIFICDICGNNFQKRNLLNFHMKIHRNEKSFECEFCEKRFNSACNLTAHMRTHTGEKPFVCQYCQRRFSDRSTQKKHERIHTNEKPFKCMTCNKCFSLSTTLKAHEKIHSGEKPHKCETCEKAFTLPHQLKAHYSTHIHQHINQLQKE